MAFAGSWYPGSAAECEASISGFLKEKHGPLSGDYTGGIVPHAGWFYSGSIACRVIASLQSRNPVDLVIFLGGHMHPDDQPFILSYGAVQTPFGDMTVAEDLVDDICNGTADCAIKSGGMQKLSPARFPDENTLELQYPFAKFFFPDAKIIACCVPPSSFAGTAGRVMITAAKKQYSNIKVIGSTDMTHYGPNYGFAPAGTGKEAVAWVKEQNDKQAVDALLTMDPDRIIGQGLKNRNMCCSGAAAAAASACKANGAVRAEKLDYATSYEKSAGSSFVGYSGILYSAS